MRITECRMRNDGKTSETKGSQRGVALIIVLLVTALLIALIFEFAYGTRISLRATVNFRDSQRAYYLARSGVNFVGRLLVYNLQTDSTGTNRVYDNMEQLEWQTVPFVPGSDTELRVRWEDESSKIRITDIQNTYTKAILQNLFEKKEIDRAVIDKLADSSAGIYKLSLLTGLHKFMSDEEYGKVYKFLTVDSTVNKININTAPDEVLESLGISPDAVSLIRDDRKKGPITDPANYAPVNQVMIPGTATFKALNLLTDKSNVFKVYSYATVGGYTKQVEAVIRRTPMNFSVSYWRVL